MSLSGPSIAHYRVDAKLGEGGMGEVWRAHDSKLERDVALKLLPAAFVADADRLARFEREAKLLAQLNHPSIAQIYGIETSGDSHALVMELVEGPTLADRLEPGSLPLAESLSIARQIAEALEEAHEKGIIHRDLKPQNVKASIEGKVKVLDFGLAKAMDPGTAGGSASPLGSPSLLHSPTLTSAGTELGVILGTAAYMSPEQAKGVAVDKRADIWSFGVILFEMLSGRRLFHADSVAETLALVLARDLDLSGLPESTPAWLERLVARCLERDPKLRLRDIGEARVALARGTDTEPAAAVAEVAPRKFSLGRIAPWALALVALGAAAGWLARRPVAAETESVPKFALRRLTELPGPESHPDLSPDGRQLVYTSAASGNPDLYLLRVGGGRAINLTADSPVADEQAAFSPDGEAIVFRSERDGGGLFLMGATGESVRRLTDAGFDPAWSPDGKSVAYSLEGVVSPYARDAVAELWIVDVATGEKRRRLPGDAVQPAWSPDGGHLAYWANSSGQRDLWTVGAESGEPVAVTADLATDWSPEWSPDGRWLYFSSDRAGGMNLFRVAIDAATGAAAGAPEQVTTSVGNLGYARFAADGQRMVAAAYERRVDLELYRLDPEAEPPLQPLRTLRPRALHWCNLSPDAEWLACATLGAPEDLVLLRADGSELRRLTDDVHKDRHARWSPDGERLLLMSTRAGGWDYWTLRADGSELRRLTEIGEVAGAAWSADGREVTVKMQTGPIYQVDAARLATPESARPLAMPAALTGFSPSAWSPSGRYLAGAEIDALWQALSVGFLDPASGVYNKSDLPIAGDGYWAVGGWLADSRRFIALGSRQLALVDAETGRWRSLAPIEGAGRIASLSRDGRTMLIEVESVDGDVWLLDRE